MKFNQISLKLLALAWLPACLTACLSAGSQQPEESTLGDLDAIEPLQHPQSQDSHPSASEHYRSALELTDNPSEQIAISARLAALEMQAAEQRQLSESASGPSFDAAIAAYRDLLEKQPRAAGNDRILYQLARAYEMDGRLEDSMAALGQLSGEYPDSSYAAEANFRRGEMLFSEQQYQSAEAAYAVVIKQGRSNPHYQNAVYMRGWAQFKQGDYRDSLNSFSEILERLVPASGALALLDRGDREMVEDSLRVMSLSFSYLDGTDTIESVFARKGPRRYHHLLYGSLAEFYLEKQRYRDAADTFVAYLARYPDSRFAPGFSANVVETYRRGGYPSLAVPAREQFIEDYGIGGDYWASTDDAMRQRLRPQLSEYLKELASFYHTRAQMLQKNRASESMAASKESFSRASAWYAQFVETFPDDEAAAEMRFLLAESLYEAGDYKSAVKAYEEVAYAYRDPARAPEAAYAGIIAGRDELAAVATAERPAAQWRQIKSALRFAETFPEDERAVPVLAEAADKLLLMEQLSEAITVAAMVTDWSPPADRQWRLKAWLVQGQAHFDLGDYIQAEVTLAEALVLVPDGDVERAAVADKLAASIYQRGETLLLAGEQRAAVDQMLRVQQVTPESDIAVKAQYDAATYLLELEDWAGAEQVLSDFRARYSSDPLAADMPAKLAEAYLQQEKWALAAVEMNRIAQSDTELELRRQSLFSAAELYQKAGQPEQAIASYLDYVEKYSEPFAQLTEARYQLASLYEARDEPKQRRHWLEQLIEGQELAGEAATERSTYLAAQAQTVFADDAYQAFNQIPLVLPLSPSLKKKLAALKLTMDAYQRVLEYEIAEFTTLASFRIGDVYARLSQDLIRSERPPGLDQLELEQYELLLEEQAYPFEEKAIEIFESNARRAHSGLYDEWVRRSFSELAILLPARYDKAEKTVAYSNDMY